MKLTATDASLSVGVPLTKVNGTAELTGATRNGKLSELSGVIDLPSLSLTTRDLTNAHAEIVKRSGQDAMTLQKIQAQIAGASVAGQIEWTIPRHRCQADMR